MKESILNKLFNPGYCGYYVDSTKNKREDKKVAKVLKRLTSDERDYFEQICAELEKDLVDIGAVLSFSSRILIRKIAMNTIFLRKIVFQLSTMSLVTKVPKEITLVRDGINGIYTPMYYDFDTHPFFEKLFFKTQREIDKGLEMLGLLPSQQLERQKLTIVRKLRQKYKDIYGTDHILEAKAETKKNSSLVRKKKEIAVV